MVSVLLLLYEEYLFRVEVGFGVTKVFFIYFMKLYVVVVLLKLEDEKFFGELFLDDDGFEMLNYVVVVVVFNFTFDVSCALFNVKSYKWV